MTSREIAEALGYKDARNARLHLNPLVSEGLVSRHEDRRYERGHTDLDEVAERHGVLGATNRQRQRYEIARDYWGRWFDSYVTWCQTGQLIDPDTGEVLDVQRVPSRKQLMRVFRQRVLAARANRNEELTAAFWDESSLFEAGLN
jgi:hypothetical protein